MLNFFRNDYISLCGNFDGVQFVVKLAVARLLGKLRQLNFSYTVDSGPPVVWDPRPQQACSRHQQCSECNQSSTGNKHEDFTIEVSSWVGMSHSVNHATHQPHQTIELQTA